MPIAKLELLGGDGLRAVGVDDDGVHQDVAELAPVRPGIHAHAAAGRARDRRGELEPAEAGVAGAVQADRVRRAAAGEDQLAVDARRRQLSREPDDDAHRPRRRAAARSSRGRSARRASSAVGGPARAPPAARRRDCGRASQRAAPPVPIVVKRESGDVLVHAHRLSRPAGRRPGRRRRRRARARRPRGARAVAGAPRLRRRSAPRRRARRGRESPSITSLPVTPGDRLLPRRVDVRHRDVVRRRERFGELVGEMPGARVEMRLEEDAQRAARVALAGGLDRAGDLRRMVGVVVDHRDAPERVHLEPAAGAGELCEQRSRLAARDARGFERRERRSGVLAIQPAGQRERALVRRCVAHDRRSASRARRRTRFPARRATRTRCDGRARCS